MITSSLASKLGLRLKRHFQMQSITQEDLAVLFGVSQTRISRIFSGQFTARSEIARKLCEKADIPFLDSLRSCGRPDESETEERIQSVSQALLLLAKEDKAALARLALLLRQL